MVIKFETMSTIVETHQWEVTVPDGTDPLLVYDAIERAQESGHLTDDFGWQLDAGSALDVLNNDGVSWKHLQIGRFGDGGIIINKEVVKP